jgi:hypothetical protein
VTEQSAQGFFILRYQAWVSRTSRDFWKPTPHNEFIAMEAIMETDLEIIRLELKYCERCGGLWIRELGSGEVYCSLCVAQMLDLPVPRPRRKAQLLFVDRPEIRSQGEDWPAFCVERGNA